MDAPISWIKEFANINTTDKEYADKMTMLGQKVERYWHEGDGISNVVTGKITSIEKHPDADKLLVCKVAVGIVDITVVTGAKNVKEGDVVPVALNGATLPGGKTITSGELRGVTSEGMLCSLSELGLSVHDFPDCIEDGIMILPANTPVGEDVVKLLHLDDTIFEFEITPNRPDCLSVIGLARETAAVYGVPFSLSYPSVSKESNNINDILKVAVKTDNCLRYSAGAVKNVKIEPSPQWMRERLRKCGLRPINNIVDITNYVMLEYGQPMHAFDLKHVKDSHIIVRQANDGEKIVTLDGSEHTLDESNMVIADAENPSAVAGVMGGEYSGIYDDTNTVIFESACFDRLSVRFTAKKLGLRTDSSSRFEKGLDPHNTIPALYRALQLVEQLGAGEIVGGIIDVHGDLPQPTAIPLDTNAINAHLGTDLSADYMIDALTRLGFSIDENLLVTPPTFRADAEGMVDLAEEIARMYGYDRIPSTIMSGIATARPTERQRFERALKQLAVGAGLYETTTLSFMSKKSLDNIHVPMDSSLRNAVKISNPFGEETSLMRTTLLPSILEVVARNYSVRAKSVGVFELAATYLPHKSDEELPDEQKSLTIGGYGSIDYYSLKGIVERFAAFAGTGMLRFEPMRDNPSFHPGRAAKVYAGDTAFAMLGELHPAVMENYGIRERCYAAEIDIETLFSLRGPTIQYRPLPRFPAITRDLALVSDESTMSAEIESVIRDIGGALLESVRAFDVYRGEGIGAGKKSTAYSLTLRNSERTLTDEDADRVVADSLAALQKIGVTLRS